MSKRVSFTRRVPHVTLKSIANNEEIDAIHAKWQEQLEPLRAEINQAAGQELAGVGSAARGCPKPWQAQGMDSAAGGMVEAAPRAAERD